MLEILTYLLCVYLIVKGVEVLTIALASARPKRGPIIILGAMTLAACVVAAIAFTVMQTEQAESLSRSLPHDSPYGAEPVNP